MFEEEQNESENWAEKKNNLDRILFQDMRIACSHSHAQMFFRELFHF